MDTEEYEGDIDGLLRLALKGGALRYGQFTLSSGERSQFYFDGRVLSLSPRGSKLIGSVMLPMIRAAGAEAIGGPTLGADPIVTAVSLLSGLDGGIEVPGVLIRKDPKGHGTGQLIEGLLPPKAKIAIVDDTCTSGNSLIHAIRAVEEAECTVVLVAVVLDRCQGGKERIEGEGYPFLSLLEADQDGTVKKTETS